MSGDYALPALSRLSSEDQEFALAFVRGSGRLNEMARRYGVSYPTVRNRLDELIARLDAMCEPPDGDMRVTTDDAEPDG